VLWLKNGSFGFACVSACAVGAKPNVPLVRLAKIVLKKCLSIKKIKHEALGCRVGKKSAVEFICCLKVSIIFCQFNGCCVGLYACLQLVDILNQQRIFFIYIMQYIIRFQIFKQNLKSFNMPQVNQLRQFKLESRI
jgi:hypothetical protein